MYCDVALSVFDAIDEFLFCVSNLGLSYRNRQWWVHCGCLRLDSVRRGARYARRTGECARPHRVF